MQPTEIAAGRRVEPVASAFDQIVKRQPLPLDRKSTRSCGFDQERAEEFLIKPASKRRDGRIPSGRQAH